MKFNSPYGKIICKKCGSLDTSLYPNYFVCFNCKTKTKLKKSEYESLSKDLG